MDNTAADLLLVVHTLVRPCSTTDMSKGPATPTTIPMHECLSLPAPNAQERDKAITQVTDAVQPR